MTLIAFALTKWLGMIALIHVFWAFGGIWPARGEAQLARAVVGARGITRMPSATACTLAGAAIGTAAVWPLLMIGRVAAPWPTTVTTLIGALIAIALLVRGLAAYIPAWRLLVPEQPFATLDRYLYGPLCLCFAAGYLVLL